MGPRSSEQAQPSHREGVTRQAGRRRSCQTLGEIIMLAYVQEIEKRLGRCLPGDYRGFLVTHHDSLLDCARRFTSPRSGVIDLLLTAEEILKNDDQNRIGIPDKSMMHIGGNLSGGYLYLQVSEEGYGEIHYMERHVFRDRFTSFAAFLNETQPESC